MQVRNNVTEEWHGWIKDNEGLDKTEMFKRLLAEDFNFMSISKALSFVPTVNMEWFTTPVVATGESEPIVIAGGTKIENDKIEMWVLDGFLNEQECKSLIKTTKNNMNPSGVDTPNPSPDIRTSRTSFSVGASSELGKKLEWRICQLTGLDPRHAETLQGCHYEIGEEYKEHPDFFDPSTSNKIGKLGQRSYTVMIYLNDVEEGGETVFPKCGISLTPKQGTVVVWNNLNSDGSLNHNSVHMAKPVLKGAKTIITKWFRTSKGLPVFSDITEHAPRYTEKGFEITALFDTQFKRITEIYEAHKKDEQPESVPRYLTSVNNNIPSTVMPFTEEEGMEISDMVQSRLEEWAGVELEPTTQYGFRDYKRGAVLSIHRDRENTHIVSAIINIAQIVDEEWYLNVEDYYNHKHEIALQPQCMVFYEGRNLLHGRAQPFEGDSYVNLFIHFKEKVT
jgi:prolyl 4-hydroxylase